MDALNPQFEHRFAIVASRADFVGHPLVSAPRNAHAGDTVNLKWQARVSNLDHYEVLASMDRGGQFELIGTSDTASFSWTIPADVLRCSYFFKVAAVLTDGKRIDSVVDTTQLVYVGSR